MKLFGSYIVKTTNTAQALDALRERSVMGVVCPHVWSDKAMQAAEQAVIERSRTLDGYENAFFISLPDDSRLKTDPAFTEDFRNLKSFFCRLGVGLLGRHSVTDLSRIEPITLSDKRSSRLHVDLFPLSLITTPAGFTTKLLASAVAGTMDEDGFFAPSGPVEAPDRLTTLPQDACAVFKGFTYPYGRFQRHRGMLHVRDTPLSDLKLPGRVVVRLTV